MVLRSWVRPNTLPKLRHTGHDSRAHSSLFPQHHSFLHVNTTDELFITECLQHSIYIYTHTNTHIHIYIINKYHVYIINIHHWILQMNIAISHHWILQPVSLILAKASVMRILYHSICHLGLLYHYHVSFDLDVPSLFYPLPSFFFFHVLPKRHRMGVYFKDLSTFLLIIVVTWHLLPSALAFFILL